MINLRESVQTVHFNKLFQTLTIELIQNLTDITVQTDIFKEQIQNSKLIWLVHASLRNVYGSLLVNVGKYCYYALVEIIK